MVSFGDSAFANAAGCKSQCGAVHSVTAFPDQFVSGRYDLGVPMFWHSGVIKRVVRSTLAAEAYGVSEALETGMLIGSVLAELITGRQMKCLADVDHALQWPLLVITDSQNLALTVPKDTTSVSDKRLRIVVAMLRQVFIEDQLATLRWLPTNAMLADQLTKEVKSPLILAWTQAAAAAAAVQIPRSVQPHTVAMVVPDRSSDTCSIEEDSNDSFVLGIGIGIAMACFYTGFCWLVWFVRRLCCRTGVCCRRREAALVVPPSAAPLALPPAPAVVMPAVAISPIVPKAASAASSSSAPRRAAQAAQGSQASAVQVRDVQMQTDASLQWWYASPRMRYGVASTSSTVPHDRGMIDQPLIHHWTGDWTD